jgi:hypothetical protein
MLVSEREVAGNWRSLLHQRCGPNGTHTAEPGNASQMHCWVFSRVADLTGATERARYKRPPRGGCSNCKCQKLMKGPQPKIESDIMRPRLAQTFDLIHNVALSSTSERIELCLFWML